MYSHSFMNSVDINYPKQTLFKSKNRLSFKLYSTSNNSEYFIVCDKW